MASGSGTASIEKQLLLEGFKKLTETANSFKVIPPPSHAKQNQEYTKTGPGHEAKGAGTGGGDGGRDGGGHDDGKPKKGFIFCLICREYILLEDFEDHVKAEHPLAGDVDDDE